MLTFLVLLIALEWLHNLQPYRPTPGQLAGKWWACPVLLARVGHYAAVPLVVLWLIVSINAK